MIESVIGGMRKLVRDAAMGNLNLKTLEYLILFLLYNYVEMY